MIIKKSIAIVVVTLSFALTGCTSQANTNQNTKTNININTPVPSAKNEIEKVLSPLEIVKEAHPLSVEAARKKDYPGSEIIIEESLNPGSNYKRYLASYTSEGNKIYALLTVPNGTKPSSGWPVIVFNHGYINPKEYRTTERYIAYTDIFSRNGYIVFKSDYRGHGNSEGVAQGGYSTNDYTTDVLNAVSSIKQYNDADPNRIGMWGHSMGGYITLRSMVISNDIKAGVIWAGVVGSYADLLTSWRRSPSPSASATPVRNSWRQMLLEQFGDPEKNPDIWNALSANAYLSDISGPVQLHHGTADTSVPYEFSQKLEQQLKEKGKEVELYTYEGDDHNLSKNLRTALNRSVDYFDKNVKGGE